MYGSQAKALGRGSPRQRTAVCISQRATDEGVGATPNHTEPHHYRRRVVLASVEVRGVPVSVRTTHVNGRVRFIRLVVRGAEGQWGVGRPRRARAGALVLAGVTAVHIMVVVVVPAVAVVSSLCTAVMAARSMAIVVRRLVLVLVAIIVVVVAVIAVAVAAEVKN
jgi:hypothetical protein